MATRINADSIESALIRVLFTALAAKQCHPREGGDRYPYPKILWELHRITKELDATLLAPRYRKAVPAFAGMTLLSGEISDPNRCFNCIDSPSNTA